MALFSRIPIGIPLQPASRARRAAGIAALCLAVLAAGCSRLHHERKEYVYVWARHMFLRDRVAAVSNRVAQVDNGQRLQVLEHQKRFFQVKTDKGEVGWIPDRAVIDQRSYNAFVQLAESHKNAPVVAHGVLRDDMYVHVTPGRDSDRFYLLPENGKVELLVRASFPKAVTPNARPVVKPGGAGKGAAADEPPPMEDWWLVRDAQGHAGWLLGGRVDVSVPDEIAQFAEGQRIVGAYVLTKVHDAGAQTQDHQIAEYVTAMAPTKAGLPYDFDQVRVFTWNTRKHRYETAFRLHPIQGYLPVLVSTQPGQQGTEPVFSFLVAKSSDVTVNPETGIARPASSRTIRYALRDTSVRRIGPDMAPIPMMKNSDAKAKTAAKSKKR